MYIDFLEKRWHRVTITSENADRIKELLNNGKIYSSDDVFEHCKEADYRLLEDIGGTQLDVEEHDMYATIQAFNDDNEEIYANGKS
tara:strand:- start:1120 stop:1377 length:258 start_codon:yes stop_codon:yes gene_type:complete